MSATSTRAPRLANRAVIGVFLLMIGVPFIGTLLRLDFMAEASDQRPRAQFPNFNNGLAGIKKFPRQCEAWFNDHFGFRGPMIHALSFVKDHALGTSPSSNVLLGRDGWLYYKHMQVGTDFEEVRPFTAEELEKWRRALERRQQWLRRHDSDYLLFLPPDKQTIYPEHLPPQLRPRNASVRLDQLVQHLRQHSTVTVIDVRQQLLEAKQRNRAYHATDSHWSCLGAFIGYRAVAEELARKFPRIKPMEKSEWPEYEYDLPVGDLSRLIDRRDGPHERCVGLWPRHPLRAHKSDVPVLYDEKRLKVQFGVPYAQETGDTSLPRCVLFHDSFALSLLPMLAEHFQRLAIVWDDELHQDIVLHEQPDIVIQQLTERKLGYVRPGDIGE